MAAVAANKNNINGIEPNFYECPKQLKSKQCQQTFAKDNGFMIIETVKDGDCMYDALSIFGELSRYHELQKSRQALRKIMVEYLLSHIEKFFLFGFNIKQIKQLSKSGIYNCDAGDLPPANISNAFNVNVIIFKYNDSTKKVDRIIYPKKGAQHTIHLLHSHAHYRLLLHIDQIFKYELQDILRTKKYTISGFNPLVNSNKNKTRKSSYSSSSNSNSNSGSNSSSRNGNDGMVYSVPTSKVYHIFKDDAGHNYEIMHITTANELGKTLCKKCEKKQFGTRKNTKKPNNTTKLNELLDKLSLGKITPEEEVLLTTLLDH